MNQKTKEEIIKEVTKQYQDDEDIEENGAIFSLTTSGLEEIATNAIKLTAEKIFNEVDKLQMNYWNRKEGPVNLGSDTEYYNLKREFL